MKYMYTIAGVLLLGSANAEEYTKACPRINSMEDNDTF